jgi:hypothetical protein
VSELELSVVGYSVPGPSADRHLIGGQHARPWQVPYEPNQGPGPDV